MSTVNDVYAKTKHREIGIYEGRLCGEKLCTCYILLEIAAGEMMT